MNNREIKENEQVVLALSGGGFRASLFHIGTVAYLKHAGLLSNVTHLLGVSGGAIVAAFLASRWQEIEEAKDDKFIELMEPLIALTEKDIRGKIMRRTLMFRSQRISVYRRELSSFFKRKRLSELSPQAPELGILATNLSTGLPVAFSQKGYLEYSTKPDKRAFHSTNSIPTALAVAASSAFPVLFPPVAVTSRELGLRSGELRQEPHYLGDGGIIDNLGLWYIDYLREEYKDLRALISDASGGFEISTREKFSGPLGIVKTMARSTDIMMKSLASDTKHLSQSTSDYYVSIEKADIPLEQHPLRLTTRAQNSLSLIRTDLDAFSPLEANALFAHAYALATQAIGEDKDRPKPPRLPHDQTEQTGDSGQVEHALEDAQKREYFRPLFSLRRDLAGTLSVAGFIVLLATPIAFTVVYHKDLIGFRSHPFSFELTYPTDLSITYAQCFPDFITLNLDQCGSLKKDPMELKKHAQSLHGKIRSAVDTAHETDFNIGDATLATLIYCGFLDAEKTREGNGTGYTLLTQTREGFWVRVWSRLQNIWTDLRGVPGSLTSHLRDLKGFILFKFNEDPREYNFAFTGQGAESGFKFTIAQPDFSGGGPHGASQSELKPRPAAIWSAEFEDVDIKTVEELEQYMDEEGTLNGKAWYKLDRRLPLLPPSEMPNACKRKTGDKEETGIIQFADILLAHDD